MGLACTIGLHRWIGTPTARDGTTAYRCARCRRAMIVHGGHLRTRKRIYLATAVLVSGGMWFVGYNLTVHGRTRVLHTAATATRTVEVAAARGRAAIHRAQGDRGAYLDGGDGSGSAANQSR